MEGKKLSVDAETFYIVGNRRPVLFIDIAHDELETVGLPAVFSETSQYLIMQLRISQEGRFSRMHNYSSNTLK